MVISGATASRRVKGTVHWVSASHACDAELRLYDRLFRSEDPEAGGEPHYIPLAWVKHVEMKVHLNQPGAEAKAHWTSP